MAHYQRWKTRGDPGGAAIQERGRTGCKAEDCAKPHYSLGYCATHYERFRAKGVVDDASFQAYGRTVCSVPDCENKHFQHGYCMKHDYRMRAWGTTESRPPVCTVDDCDRRALAKGQFAGLCRKHADRKAATGTTDDPRPDLRTRFLAKADRSDEGGCWPWTGFVDEEGYARVRANGRSRPAYRIAYELFKEPVPAGLGIDHLCHTRDTACPGGTECPHRRCVNPEHLEAVTASVNAIRGWDNTKALRPNRRK